MVEEEKKEFMVDAPSSQELRAYEALIEGGPGTLVLVACVFEGCHRFAIAKAVKIRGKMAVEILAVVLNESDSILLKSTAGDVVSPCAFSKSAFN
jgi:hypothetical protein